MHVRVLQRYLQRRFTSEMIVRHLLMVFLLSTAQSWEAREKNYFTGSVSWIYAT